MHPKRKKRLLIVLAGLAVVAVASGLILNAFRSNLVFFHTPTEIAAGQVDAGQVIRVGGLVEAGSVEREPGGLRVHFVITDTARSVPVRYEGILPDLFREGHGTVVQGRIGTDGVLAATQVLAKHDENYMPPEAADAIQRAGETVVQ
ncbi:cytochrome c maturation protein CcmE [Laribacter hongkongensis]|uniref:cytochrome c maturation protein CcmE n=1 Tax=Laribacter hongkongensis TaxID=168471 RepID=UPI001EFD6953|nr:cytochrome c maturation protein CcmE [Laribacter hongkongensis]MCG9058517.1 cytochrome c maturation protein CcmE [Laribacter hongkongensis]MCG9085314.1 cytochrome c maturation protein CcmE [Laribacter hongkongensis]